MPLVAKSLPLLFVLKINSICQVQACSSDFDCALGQWCASHTDGHTFCKDFASLGQPCNFLTDPENEERCDPQEYRCFEPDSCFRADTGGICEPKWKKYEVDNCCKSDKDCESRLCAMGETELGSQALICQASTIDEIPVVDENPPLDEAPEIEDKPEGEDKPEVAEDPVSLITDEIDTSCSIDFDCALGQWCASHTDGHTFCKDFASLGQPCNFLTDPENEERCDPQEYRCFEPDSCFRADTGGICEPKWKKYEVDDCCKSDKDCESGLCTMGETELGSQALICQDPVQIEDNVTEPTSESDCLVRDIIYSNGDYIGYIGFECIDDSSFDGMESYCIDGEVVQKSKILTCDENISRCFQCGERGWGQVVCRSQPDPTCEKCIEGSEWANMENKLDAFSCPCPGNHKNGGQEIHKMLRSRIKRFQSETP